MRINTRQIKIYTVKIQNINCEFCFEMGLNHLEKEMSLELPDSKYQELQNTFVHLKDKQINSSFNTWHQGLHKNKNTTATWSGPS